MQTIQLAAGKRQHLQQQKRSQQLPKDTAEEQQAGGGSYLRGPPQSSLDKSRVSDDRDDRNHPYKIRWDFFCQVRNDWQKRLNQFYPEVMGKSTNVNRSIIVSMFGLVLYYDILAVFTTISFKYSLVIRNQLFLCAAIMNYCGGVIWGCGIGNPFLIARLQSLPGIAASFMVVSGGLSLWAAAFSYSLGYLLMTSSCTLSVGILCWMSHRGLLQSWQLYWMAPLLGLCIVSMLVGQVRASRLIAWAEKEIEEADLGDYFSITSIVKGIVPKWMKEIMFYDDTELVEENGEEPSSIPYQEEE